MLGVDASLCESWELAHAADVDAAGHLLADRKFAPPDLIVLAESRDGQHSHQALATLRQQAPLARVWRLLGSWCEGQARSGRPPEACLATYWHGWEARFGSQMRIARDGGSPSWSLPVTATPDERILDGTADQFERPRSGLIAICAGSATAAGAIADLCRAAGLQCVVGAADARLRAAGATAVVWDTEVDQMADAQQVARLRGWADGAPLVACVGFPRTEDVENAKRAGVAAVVAKPFLAGDLLWHLDRLPGER